MNIFIHELTPTLAFTTNMYKLYKAQPVTKEIMWQGQKKVFMMTPKVVEAARKHYGCNSLVGVQLEDRGPETSALTHWESRIMLGDYMISNDFEERAISDITLALFALFEDSIKLIMVLLEGYLDLEKTRVVHL